MFVQHGFRVLKVYDKPILRGFGIMKKLIRYTPGFYPSTAKKENFMSIWLFGVENHSFTEKMPDHKNIHYNSYIFGVSYDSTRR